VVVIRIWCMTVLSIAMSFMCEINMCVLPMTSGVRLQSGQLMVEMNLDKTRHFVFKGCGMYNNPL